MSANEIELTFIRCPSCKSLMPSTAVKCGMCGFDLGGSDDAASELQQKKPRLRQKTFSGEVDQFIEPEKSSGFFSPIEMKEDYVDPHTQSYDAPDAPRESTAEHPEEEDAQEQNEVRNKPDNEKRGSLRFSEDRSRETSDHDQEPDESSSKPASDNEGEPAGDAPVRKKRKRKRKKKNVQSDPESNQGTQGTVHDSSIRRVTPLSRKVEHESEDSRSGHFEPHDEKKTEDSDVPENKRQTFFADKKREDVPGNEWDQPGFEVETRTSFSSEKVVSKGEENMLIGWFVNYSTNKKGSSFEIRIGRQFVGRQSLRGDDLIIQDSAISTPHCLLQVEDSGAVLLQDLMSEQGTFVKKSADSDYRQIDTSVKLEHGDKVKLGSFEMVVCLIPL